MNFCPDVFQIYEAMDNRGYKGTDNILYAPTLIVFNL